MDDGLMVERELEDDDVDLTSEQLAQALFQLTYPFSENELDFGIEGLAALDKLAGDVELQGLTKHVSFAST